MNRNVLKRISGFTHGLMLSMMLIPAIWSPYVSANLSGATMSTFTSTPIEIVQTVPPLVMLSMSMDHQYFQRAYNDYTDLTGDGDTERTYDDTFGYYGYFHSNRCYQYTDGTTTFAAVGIATGTNKHYCSGGLDNAWSGNFLNWATMTRMDIVRKILYGGYRSSVANGDTAASTILERAHLPGDAHSFVKYYNGADINDLIPSSYGSLKVDKANGGDNDGIDDSDEGISICNISYKSAGSSQGTTTATASVNPDPAPMMRVVKKNYQLWTANEVRQCTWENENGDQTNGNNSAFSGIFAGSSDPNDSEALRTPGTARDHIVRVKVCEATYFDAEENLENCKYYGANLKPEGLLQRYGLNGQIKFGLMTGSYAKNISGGVLRKAVGALTDEVDVSNGTFIPKSGTQPGIIRSLNAVRVWGYSYNGGTYFGTNSGDTCSYQLTNITEGQCRSWGNPMSEIYLESLRYFAVSGGRNPTTSFNADDSTSISGLVSDSWSTDPLGNNNECAAINSLVFNASVSSYDDNETNGMSASFGSVTTLTNAVGDGEGISGNNFFIGRAGGATNEFCTSKPVAGLGDAFGLCPEAPTVRGSFHMAGLAHYAQTNDLRTDLEGDQKLRTFAVSLATSTPAIDVPIGTLAAATKHVRILPAYRLRGGGNSSNEASNVPANDGGGALVDFKIITPHTEVASAVSTVPTAGTGHFYGKFWMNWEDSEQGGDFDQDVWGVIEYRVNTNVSPATVQVTTNVVSAIGGGFSQLFGFIIGGTTQDGFHAYSGFKGAQYYGSVGTDPSGVPGCGNPTTHPTGCGAPGNFATTGTQQGARSHTFTVAATPAAELLESPLYYAAKWGGFDDRNGDDTPDLQTEWDLKDSAGNFVDGGDGIPDNFFFVTNPGALEDSLTIIFNTILERVSSGTAAAVVANDQIGTGAVFQALYDPVKRDATAARNEAKWIGTLHALWIDSSGRLREDGGVKGTLEDFNTDRVVELFYDDVDRRTKVRRYTSAEDESFSEPTSFTEEELNTLQPIWNARERLSDLDDATVAVDRAYEEASSEGRHLLTWIDADTDGVPEYGGTPEVVPFSNGSVSSSNFVWFDTNDENEAQQLIQWARGQHNGMSQYRSRLLDYDGDGDTTTPGGHDEVMRLGDIVHSTPVSVGAPNEALDAIKNDTSYTEFRTQYEDRRQVVYVGANDGMIHAFNAGFFSRTDKKFELSLDGETEHPLGGEIWGYVPKNLLPHLQWMARKDYSHVYYVDNTMRTFDVKIFADDADHPNGWGTILVATMNLGGGSDETGITVDTAQDGVGVSDGDGDLRDDVKTKSAVVVLDITNPENPPVVLAELTPPNLQFTTSIPQVTNIVDSSDGSPNAWYLVLGSGPSDINSVSYESGDDPNKQFASLYVYNLTDLDQGLDDTTADKVNGLALPPVELADEDVYIGNLGAADFDLDQKIEAFYFGTVGAASDDPAVNQGSLYRVTVGEEQDPVDWSAPFKLVDGLNQPFARRPTVVLDARLRPWVTAASGRYLVQADKLTEATQTLYGFIDRNASDASATPVSVDSADLVDVSDARVFSNGEISLDGDVTTETTYDDLKDEVVAVGGWKRDFVSATGTPAERGVSGVTFFNGDLIVPAFTPSTLPCKADGSSTLIGVSFLTGTASGVFGGVPCAGCPDGQTELPPTPRQKISGDGTQPGDWVEKRTTGMSSEVKIVGGSDDDLDPTNDDDPDGLDGGCAVAQSTTGAIGCQPVHETARAFNGEISWREIRGKD